MFGRSTASRFQESKSLNTPGPGEYDIKDLKTTKKGALSKAVRKMEFQQTSEFAHLGPGCYDTTQQGNDVKVQSWVVNACVDYTAAIKKLSASWHKMYPPPQVGNQGEAPVLKIAPIKDRDDVINFLVRLVADACGASSEAISLKEELDSVKTRLVDETAAAIKPGRAQGTVPASMSMSSWKKVEPLHKAIEASCTDVNRKMTKLSNVLARLSEDLPAIIQVLSEQEVNEEKARELMDKVEETARAVDTAQKQAAEAMGFAEATQEEADKLRKALMIERVQRAKSCADADSVIQRLETEAEMNMFEEKGLEMSEDLVQWAFAAHSERADGEESLVEAMHQEILTLQTLLEDSDKRLVESERALSQLLIEKEAAADAAWDAWFALSDKFEKASLEAQESHLALMQEANTSLANVETELQQRNDIVKSLEEELSQLRSEASEQGSVAQHKISDLQSACDERDQALDENRTKLDECTSSLASALAELTECRNKLEQCTAELNGKSEEACQLQATIVQNDNKLAQRDKDLAQCTALLESTLDLYRQTDRALAENAASLDTCSACLAECKDKLAGSTSSLESARARFAECQASLDAKTDKVSQLEASLSSARCDVNTVHNEVQQFRTRSLDKLDKVMKLSVTASSELQSSLAAKSQELAALDTSMKALKQKSEKDLKQITELEESCASLKTSLKDQETETEGLVTRMEEMMASMNEKFAKMENKSLVYKGRAESAEQRVSELENTMTSLQGNISSLEGETQEKDNKVEMLAGTIARLESKLAEEKENGESKSGKVSQLEGNMTRLNGRVSELESSVSAFEKELQAAKDESYVKSQRIERLEAGIVSLETAVAEKTKQLDKAVEKIGALESDMAEAEEVREVEQRDTSEQLASLQADVQRRNAEINELNEKLSDARSDSCYARSECESRVVELLGLQETLMDMAGNIGKLDTELSGIAEEAAQKMSELKDVVVARDQELAHLQENLAKSNAILSNQTAEVAQLKTILSDHESALKLFQDAANEMTESIEVLEHTITEKEGALAEGQKQLEEEKDRSEALTHQVLELQNTVEQRQDTVKSLEDALSKANEDLQQQIECAKAQEESSEDRVEKLKEECKELNDDLERQASEVEALRERLELGEKAIEEASEMRNKIADLESLLKEVDSGEEKRKDEEMARAKELCDVKNKLHKALGRVKAVADVNESYRAEMQSLLQAAEEVDALRDRLAVLEKDNAELVAQNVHLVGHNNLKQKIQMHAKVKEENNVLKNEKATLERQLQQHKAALNKMYKLVGDSKEVQHIKQQICVVDVQEDQVDLEACD